MTVELEAGPEGTILPIQAHPGGKKNEIKGVQNGWLKVTVTQIPERGKANRAIADFLAKSLGLKKSQMELVSGETASKKRFLVRSVTCDELSEKIKPFL